MTGPNTYTPDQLAAHAGFRRWAEHAAPLETHPDLAPALALIEGMDPRGAADWLDRYHSQTLGHAQYADQHAGTVHLVRLTRPITGHGMTALLGEGQLALARITPPLGVLPGRATAWSPHADVDIALQPGDYTVVKTAGPRPDPADGGPLLTPVQWCAQYGVRVRDADGWNGADGRDWNDEITLAEFARRTAKSTVEGSIRGDKRMYADIHAYRAQAAAARTAPQGDPR